VQNAWLVIECVPEKLDAKIKIFGELVVLARQDAILATNSSSYKSSEMLANVPQESKNRILNMHYYMPPGNMVVELMVRD
jgi:3-hydroxyacyl-CoA dehydrogenase